MTDPRPGLSSMSSTLEELTRRISTLADELSSKGDDATATELFEIERSLRTGSRRLARLLGRLDT